MTTSSYVYDGREWLLTGREAVKRMTSGKEKRLYEIRPNDKDIDVDDRRYNKWVMKEELFHILED